MKFNAHKVMNFVCLPIALSLAFDVSNITRVCLAIVFATGGYRCGSVLFFILRFWQALCLSSLIGLFLWKMNAQLVTPVLAFGLLLICIALLIWNKGFACSQFSKRSDKSNVRDLVGLLSVLLIAFQAPRGKAANLRYLIAEDNEAWFRTPLSVLRTNNLDLQLIFDTTSIQYFTKFTLNSFLFIFKPILGSGLSDAAISINVVSNAWIFLALSAVLLTLIIINDFFVTLSPKSPPLLVFVGVSVIAFAFFRASLLSGHYTQLLLNVVVYSFIISIVEFSRIENIRWRRILMIVALSTGAAMVGSYNPWIGVSAGGLFLVFDLVFKPTLVTRVFSNKRSWLLALLVFPALWFAYNSLSSRYGQLDDGGGVWILNNEPIWIFVFLGSSILISLFFDFAISRPSSNDVATQKLSIANRWHYLSLIAFLFSFILIPREFDDYQWLSLLLLFPMFVSATFSGEMKRLNKLLFVETSYISVLYLGVGSFFFSSYVWLASRFVGPVFEPMYAAHKSLLAFAGQFFWLPLAFLVLIEVPGTRLFKAIKDGFVIVLVTLALGIFPFLKDSSDIASEYTAAYGGVWWMEPTLAAHDRDNQVLVLCVNGDASVDEFSVYNCNRFSSTLSLDGEIAGSFRAISLNNPDMYLQIPDLLISIDTSRNIVVLVNGQMTDGTRSLFDNPDRNIKIVEVL